MAKGAAPPLVQVVDGCRATCDRVRAGGLEFTPKLVARCGGVDAGFSHPLGNRWKPVEARLPRRPERGWHGHYGRGIRAGQDPNHPFGWRRRHAPEPGSLPPQLI